MRENDVGTQVNEIKNLCASAPLREKHPLKTPKSLQVVRVLHSAMDFKQHL